MARIESDDDDDENAPLNDRSNRPATSDSETEGPDASYQTSSPRRKRARVSHNERGVRHEGQRASKPDSRSARSSRRSERPNEEEDAAGEEEGRDADVDEVEADGEVGDDDVKPKIVTQPRDVDGYVSERLFLGFY